MFSAFTFNTQVETWYSNVKKVGEIQNGKIYPIHCVLNWVLKRKIQKWFYLFLSGCVILNKTNTTLIFKHCWGYSTFLSNFLWKYTISKVLDTQSQASGTWFREYGVHGFRGTGVPGYGYIAFHYPNCHCSKWSKLLVVTSAQINSTGAQNICTALQSSVNCTNLSMDCLGWISSMIGFGRYVNTNWEEFNPRFSSSLPLFTMISETGLLSLPLRKYSGVMICSLLSALQTMFHSYTYIYQ